jgi:hypothetical protein
MKKNDVNTKRVMSKSHQRSDFGLARYADMPLMVNVMPGIPQIIAAVINRWILFIDIW